MTTSESFELPDVDRLTAGTVGPPGQRIFFLQARRGDQVVSLKLEKTQVDALARYLTAMLADMPEVGDVPHDLDLEEPVVASWTVGSLGVSYDEDADRVLILAEELVEEGDEGAETRIRATREQIAALARRGTELVGAGRPPCPLCGYPLDPRGHTCVRKNGQSPPTL